MSHHFDAGNCVFPEREYRAAVAAYAAGDLRHAALHLGNALCSEPDQPEWLAMLDRMIDHAPDPLALAPFDGEGTYVDAALRGYVLERMGRLDEALEFLLGAAEARPDVPFL